MATSEERTIETEQTERPDRTTEPDDLAVQMDQDGEKCVPAGVPDCGPTAAGETGDGAAADTADSGALLDAGEDTTLGETEVAAEDEPGDEACSASETGEGEAGAEPVFSPPAAELQEGEPVAAAANEDGNGVEENQRAEEDAASEETDGSAGEIFGELEYLPAKPVRGAAAPDPEAAAARLSTIAEAKSVAEALLFSTVDPLSIQRLSKLMDNLHPRAVRGVVYELQRDYEDRGGALQVLEIAGGFQIATRPHLASHVMRLQRIRRRPQLSPATLETLAIVAYRQPITRADIEGIRGVESSAPVRNLQELGLVDVGGRREVPGRPQLYITTEVFLKTFGLRSLNDLPSIAELKTLFAQERRLAPPAAALEVALEIEAALEAEQGPQAEDMFAGLESEESGSQSQAEATDAGGEDTATGDGGTEAEGEVPGSAVGNEAEDRIAEPATTEAGNDVEGVGDLERISAGEQEEVPSEAAQDSASVAEPGDGTESNADDALDAVFEETPEAGTTGFTKPSGD